MNISFANVLESTELSAVPADVDAKTSVEETAVAVLRTAPLLSPSLDISLSMPGRVCKDVSVIICD